MKSRIDSQPNRRSGGSNPESLAAHAQVQSTKQKTHDRIIQYAERHGPGGLIPDEVAADFGCNHNHTSPRCSELVKSGLLVKTDRTRSTRAGGLARVLVAKQFAGTSLSAPVDGGGSKQPGIAVWRSGTGRQVSRLSDRIPLPFARLHWHGARAPPNPHAPNDG
jgi:hypothetical protein